MVLTYFLNDFEMVIIIIIIIIIVIISNYENKLSNGVDGNSI
jgi:hypothetical protein